MHSCVLVWTNKHAHSLACDVCEAFSHVYLVSVQEDEVYRNNMTTTDQMTLWEQGKCPGNDVSHPTQSENVCMFPGVFAAKLLQAVRVAWDV